MIDRRTFLAAAAVLPLACSRTVSEPDGKQAAFEVARARFEAFRATLGPGARIGVAAIDTGTGRRLVHDADARYPLASTFKLALAAAIVVRSDNSAANILLRRLGGPEALTRFMRGAGDPVSRLDRYEMELGSNLPGDPRDTTTPAAMAALVRDLVLGDRLSPASRARLVEWLTTSVPGPDRLRAGLPADWRFGHKTGTAANGGVNDVGIAWPPGRAPIVIASYQSGGDAEMPARAAAHAAVARLVAEFFA